MTPAARVAAAITILDHVLCGQPTEKALTNWARGNRYAGSKDRAAVRDHVYDALRCRRSFGYLGGSDTGRGLMIGACRSTGHDLGAIFTGDTYAPPVLSGDEETLRTLATAPRAVRWDLQDWVADRFEQNHATRAEPIAQALRVRGPVTIRVNQKRASIEVVKASLAQDQITCEANSAAPFALTITQNPRRVALSHAFALGMIELQDAASQAMAAVLPMDGKRRVLDYCAGGGGKALAIADRGSADIFAHDISPARMRDIPMRARRAGVRINLLEPPQLTAQADFDLILVDAPCSGSGSWRRAPDTKWTFTEQQLDDFQQTQLRILTEASQYLSEGGVLAYGTCSVFDAENQDVVGKFLSKSPNFTKSFNQRWLTCDDHDGFYLALLTKS